VAEESDGWDDLLVQLSPVVAARVPAADAVVRRTDPRLVPLLRAARRERLTALGRN
jgi:hypothetical protein